MEGCATTPKIQEVACVATPRIPLNLSPVHILNMEIFTWTVITEKNAVQRFIDMKSKGQDPVIYGLTKDGYKTLAIDNKRVYYQLLEIQDQIKAYQQYYESMK